MMKVVTDGGGCDESSDRGWLVVALTTESCTD